MNEESSFMIKKVKVEGFKALLDIYITNLTSRKLVAQFKDYDKTKSDVIMEIANDNDLDFELLETLINHTEKIVDFKVWFDNL